MFLSQILSILCNSIHVHIEYASQARIGVHTENVKYVFSTWGRQVSSCPILGLPRVLHQSAPLFCFAPLLPS
eukprot:36548-Pleurochrysis_carterae.AAC.1